jgi:hypothetical protein
VFVPRVAVKAEADVLVVVAPDKRAERSIPEREESGVVGIGFFHPAGMVHAVDCGSDQKEAKPPFRGCAETDIAVVEDRNGQDQGLVQQDLANRESESRDYEQGYQRGEEGIAGVESECGCRIDIRIVVVNAVEPPERADLVGCDVPAVLSEIEDRDAERPRGPGRQPQCRDE